MHSRSCQARSRKIEFLNHWFMMAYPNHCPDCQGQGFYVYSYDPSASGVSLSSGFLQESEPCPSCIEKDRCPKCGGRIEWLEYSDTLQEDHYQCLLCDWNDLKESASWIIEDECDCYEIFFIDGRCPCCHGKLSYVHPDQYGPDQDSDYKYCPKCDRK